MKFKLLIISLLISKSIFSQTINIPKVDAYLKYIENNNLGIGSLSIFKEGKEIYSRDFGQKNLTGVVDHAEKKYQVGSVTKMVTAALVFKLVEAGKLSLDDKLSDFFPQVPNSKKITIKNMLGHTSGLGSYVVRNGEIWVTEKVTEKEIFDLIIQQGVSFEPGEKVAYSNSAYYLLAKIVEENMAGLIIH
ncbi:serine hydrolase [Pedobacter sp. MR2016-19]|uniref:serine hydrolase domain-containing protein n=1 Tax=Pedobacter sp. MR2016-19 TaxID=2780089 RepID=UPI002105A051|nr:serine hydrolase domain-containing protein [Pedobacter sp. MR2016-19]